MKGLLFLIAVLLSAPSYSQDIYDYNHRGGYERFSSRHELNPPKLYSGDGTYLGELSQNKYAPDSVSNRYGRYGSRYSPDSVNNPHGQWGRYRTQPIYVYPRR
jgi:hypothetical protein